MWKELSAAHPETDIHPVTKSQLIWSWLSVHSRREPGGSGGWLLHCLGVLPCSAHRGSQDDLSRLSPHLSDVRWAQSCFICRWNWRILLLPCCSMARASRGMPLPPGRCHHALCPSGPKSTLEKAAPPSARGSWCLWSAFETHPALQISSFHRISNPPPWDSICCSGQIFQRGISRDISHGSETLSGAYRGFLNGATLSTRVLPCWEQYMLIFN